MRLTKKVDLGDGVCFEVKEVTIREVVEIFQRNVGEDVNVGNILMEALFVTTGMTSENLLDRTASDMDKIISALEDVNRNFYKIPDLLKKYKMGGMWDQFVRQLEKVQVHAEEPSPKLSPLQPI